MKRVFLILWSVAVFGSSAFGQTPLDVVGQFLGFSESQASQFRQSFEELGRNSAQIQSRMQQKQLELNRLLSLPTPDTDALGKVLLEIRALEREQSVAFERYHAAFIGMLTPAQMERVTKVIQARELVPAVAVFAAAGLVAPPAVPSN